MNIETQLEKLLEYIEENNFSGYDPYDALNSPILKALSPNSKYLRILFIQTLKRLPFNLRPLLRIRKEHNPKGIGLFLWGYAKLYAIDKREEYLATISRLLDLIEQSKSKGYSGNCWGYNFDWQSRAFYVPMYTPTIVNSSFIGHALIDTYRLAGLDRALDMALSIPDFILKDLNRTNEGDNLCFSYTPIDNTAVHNANLLGASLLIRLYDITSDSTLRSAALESLTYSMKYQRQDGSWYYAETDYQKWIDSFHTGFNLQSIKYFLDLGFASEYRKCFNQGVRFYAENFFLHDGTPKYYHNRIYPVDIHAPAQAVVFFSQMGDEYTELTDRILKWMIYNMQNSIGYFYFQKKQHFTNRIPYMRWGQAWAFHALTEYVLRQ